jgi:tRNA (mo5U34)-methyltransferase
VGVFDIVLFLGVLYHLRYPMLGLDKMAAVCRPGARVWAASLVIDGLVAGPDQTLPEIAPGLSEVPIAQFYPGTKLDEAHSSYWGPNLAAFKSMVEESGFTIERVKLPGKTAPRRALLQMQRS